MAGEHIDDLKRDWLLRQISFQDRQEELLDAELRIAQVNYANLLQQGTVYQWDQIVNIGSGNDFVMSFTTGNVPLALFGLAIAFTGTTGATVEGFVGGTVSGGAEITDVYPLNHDNPGQSPYLANSVFQGRTIDVAGVEFFDAVLAQGNRSDIAQSSGGGMILAEDQLYYFTVTNTGAQAGDFVFEFVAGAIL